MRRLDRALWIVGVVCLGTFILFTLQRRFYQEELNDTFDQMVEAPAPAPTSAPEAPARRMREGDLVGRLEIPRLSVSVMVLEGIASRTLRLGAGHIPGTPLPGAIGNSGIAAHRDTFFRPLSRIETNDEIVFHTPSKKSTYRVVSTKIVMPNDVEVLKPNGKDTITLVTCYPFYYIGPAPKRFIVTATVGETASVEAGAGSGK